MAQRQRTTATAEARTASPRAPPSTKSSRASTSSAASWWTSRAAWASSTWCESKDGGYRCYSCTLCERACPVDCIEIDYCPEFEELPFDVEAERAAALATLPGESCGAGAACVMGEKPAGFVPEIDMKLFDPVVAGIRDGSGLVEAFHATQEAFG